eukprot:CAMPEP_0197592150 /NCGR_PEP_ID=MMETSP1326-20131121/14793_1 /TAXON_ID=1155430 /ORGANISM="Genus nov. species nov., Strain RCC2288" /LENGTH=208 /DNA_ID=CAMNT_0043157805 /DNA_START=20 /DNA_END=646 /DNA_ORIENTATION=+
MAALSASVFIGNAVVVAKTTAIRAKRTSVIVQASGDAKSKAISFFAAGVIAFSASPAVALNQIELADQRVANKNGLQLIYEARDLNLSESSRGEASSRNSFQKLTTKQSLARASESVSRFNGDMVTYIDKAYWTQAANEVRRQVGTLRYDMNNLVETNGTATSRAEAKAFYKSIEALDFAVRKKDQVGAKALLIVVQDQGNALIKSLA